MTIFDRLVDLADCLCQQIKDDGLPGVCFCGVVPGEAAAAVYFGNCGDVCGMAWVRLVNMYPAASVGTINTALGNCSSELGFDVELGIMRCFPTADERGNPPPVATVKEGTSLQILDSLAMFKAVACCDAVTGKDYRMGTYQPLGPEGGIVGGIWTLSMI